MHLFFRRLWHIHRDEAGQTLLLFALLLPVLCGFAALAIDVGMLRYQKEQLQSAADAAAIAGALEISYCDGNANCAAMQTAALQAMSENGYTNVALNAQCTGTPSATGLTLTLNNGPCELGSTAEDPNYGNVGTVEAVVAKEEPTYFGRIFGVAHFLVSARAEASQGNSPYCIYVSTQKPDASGGDAFDIVGNASITASCGLMDDSGASPALSVTGNVTVATTKNSVHGTTSAIGNTGISPQPVQYAPALPDPLLYVQSLPIPTGTSYPNERITGNNTVTLNPGTYPNGITITGNSNVTLNPGFYNMQGSLSEAGNISLSGNGVTLYFSAGSLDLVGNSYADLVAPTTGEYAGILFYQNPNDTSTVHLTGNASSVFQGTFYAPDAELDITGNGNTAAYTILDAGSVKMVGNSKFHLGNDYSSLPGGSPVKGVTAVLSE